MTIVNNVLYTWKLLRERILNVNTTKTKKIMDMLTDLTVVIILQYIGVPNHHIIHLQGYMSVMSQLTWGNKQRRKSEDGSRVGETFEDATLLALNMKEKGNELNSSNSL